MENITDMLTKGVEISYEPIREVRLPEKAAFEEWLAPGVLAVSTEKVFSGKKVGVFSAEKGLIAEIKYQKAEMTPSGLIHLTGKSQALVTADGVVLAGDDCDESRDLGGGFYAKKSDKRWGIYRVADQSAVTKPEYLSVSDFSEGTFAVTTKAGAQLIGEDGMPLSDEVWDEAHPFKNGFARVTVKKETRYIDREGKVIFAAEGQSFRDFCNGYAVYSDKKGKYGAINTEGIIVIKPEYAFLKDALSDMFVASNTGAFYGESFRGRNFGLITPEGEVVLPLQYDGIVDCPDGSYRYGHQITWQANVAGTQMAYAALVYGIVSPEGKILFRDEFTGIGEESEGLRAYKRLDGGVLSFGYMTPDGKSAMNVAQVDYAKSRDKTRALLRENIDVQMRPFRDGKAQVCIRDEFRTVKIPLLGEQSFYETDKTAWYEIGKDGRPAGESPNLKQQFEAQSGRPFFGDFCKVAKGQPTMWATHILAYDGMLEANLSKYAFAIMNADLEFQCINQIKFPALPGALPQSDVQHDPYLFLTQIAKNVWLGITEKKQSVIFSEYESPTRFSEGLAAFCETGKKERWGYMDCRGNQVVPAKYKHVRPFRDGYAFAVDEQGGMILCRRATVTPVEA